MYDTIIIGAGAAGITAAIYAARANLKFEIISKDIGGLTLWSPNIENYTGYHNLTGIDLIEKFKQHMSDYKIKVKDMKAVGDFILNQLMMMEGLESTNTLMVLDTKKETTSLL